MRSKVKSKKRTAAEFCMVFGIRLLSIVSTVINKPVGACKRSTLIFVNYRKCHLFHGFKFPAFNFFT